MAEKKTRGLGRGLSALMADIADEPERTEAPSGMSDAMVPVEKIEPNPGQPRKQFDRDALSELAASIREKGIIQPLIVRKAASADGTYQIVAGERRWRAAQMAQVHEVPVIVRDLSDEEVLEIAIIENIQRADLNPVDEAAGYRQLMERFGHTQEKLAEAMGKSRSHIANSMRLLTLPMDVQDMLSSGKLSAGHARALITAEDPSELARLVVKQGLSVRQTEKLAKGPAVTKTKPVAKAPAKDTDTRMLEQDLSAAIGMKVVLDIAPGTEEGTMLIKYASLDQLDELCRKLTDN
jgi:ParB family chromosome partitioning protein